MSHRMSLVVAVVSMLIVAATAQAKSEPAAGTAPDRASIDWIKTQTIRAGYMNRWNSEELPAKLAAAGFNTMHVQFCHGGHADIKRWGQLAKESNLRFFTSVWWTYPRQVEAYRGKPTGIGTRYRGFVNAAGESHTKTACPVDERYWREWVTPDLVEMAKQADDAGICGVTIDSELYFTEEPDGRGPLGWYYYSGMCFCDHCFDDFVRSVEAKETSTDILPPDRETWLKERNHLPAYEANLKDNVEAQARRLEQAVHAIDPDLLLGFLAVYDAGGFFFDGLRDGFKTPERPVTIWTETPTYRRGYHPYVHTVRNRLRASGNVLYIPGLYLEAHAPMDLARQVRELAANTDGYWVFTRKKDLLMNATIGAYLSGGNAAIARDAPIRDETPFLDLWDKYDSVLTLPAHWRLRIDPEDVGEKEEWFAMSGDVGEWRDIPIGDFWDKPLGGPYTGAAWYRVAVRVAPSAPGEKFYLVFGAVDEDARVWFNGKPVGKHAKGPAGRSERFLIDVTGRIDWGRRNLIAVRVYNSAGAGGIWKPVRLITAK